MTEPPTDPRPGLVRSPLTGGTVVQRIRTIPAQELIEAWLDVFDIDIRTELDGVPAVELFECTETRLMFFHPSQIAGSAHLYDELQTKLDWYYDYQKKTTGDREVRWEFSRAMTQLSGCSNVVDLGAGRGVFVELARNRGLNVTGIDTSPEAVRSAEARGLPVKMASVGELVARSPGAFDGICSFQTLEHLSKPREFLEHIVTLAQPGARIIFAVPNADCYQAQLPDRDRLLDMPPHHMLRWSKRAFESLPNLFPLILDRLETEPLASYNVNAYTKAKLSNSAFGGLGASITRYPAALFRLALRMGGRRFCTGANLYASFRRT